MPRSNSCVPSPAHFSSGPASADLLAAEAAAAHVPAVTRPRSRPRRSRPARRRRARARTRRRGPRRPHAGDLTGSSLVLRTVTVYSSAAPSSGRACRSPRRASGSLPPWRSAPCRWPRRPRAGRRRRARAGRRRRSRPAASTASSAARASSRRAAAQRRARRPPRSAGAERQRVAASRAAEGDRRDRRGGSAHATPSATAAAAAALSADRPAAASPWRRRGGTAPRRAPSRAPPRRAHRTAPTARRTGRPTISAAGTGPFQADSAGNAKPRSRISPATTGSTQRASTEAPARTARDRLAHAAGRRPARWRCAVSSSGGTSSEPREVAEHAPGRRDGGRARAAAPTVEQRARAGRSGGAQAELVGGDGAGQRAPAGPRARRRPPATSSDVAEQRRSALARSTGRRSPAGIMREQRHDRGDHDRADAARRRRPAAATAGRGRRTAGTSVAPAGRCRRRPGRTSGPRAAARRR